MRLFIALFVYIMSVFVSATYASTGIAPPDNQPPKTDLRIAANEEQPVKQPEETKKGKEEELDIDPAEVGTDAVEHLEKEPERPGEEKISTEEQVNKALEKVDFSDKQKLLQARRLVVKGLKDIGGKAKDDIDEEEKDYKEQEELNRSINEWMRRTK